MTRVTYVCQTPPHDYSDACILGRCDHDSRPWWWWIAFGVYVGVMAIEFWMLYRTVAGWPVDSLSMLQRLAG